MNQPQFRKMESSSLTNPREPGSRESGGRSRSTQISRSIHPASPFEWQTALMLDSANNKLQELMQLLYLLSRDPSVPNDSRYHVTVAQSEIALLTREMRNATAEDDQPEAATGKPPSGA